MQAHVKLQGSLVSDLYESRVAGN